MPDLFGYWLTGQVGAEVTNASTTQLLSIATGEWDTELMSKLGIRRDLFPALRHPGDAAVDCAGIYARPSSAARSI